MSEPMSDRAKTAELERLLYRKHTKAAKHPVNQTGSHIFALQVANDAALPVSHFDAVAMHIHAGKRFILDIFEIKASRSDLKRELDKPDKSWAARELADRIWLVTPKGLSEGMDLPDHWGLLEATPNFTRLMTVKPAPVLRELGGWHDPRPIPRGFFVSMLQAEAHIPGKRPRKSSSSLAEIREA